MRDIIEIAIEREAELLDAVLESPEVFEHPFFGKPNSQGWLHMQTQTFSARGTSRRRFSTPTVTLPQYAN